MTYKNIGKCLDGYWENSWSDLPDEQRQAWYEVLDSLGGDADTDGQIWDRKDSKVRQYIAMRHDIQNDPALHWLEYDYSMDARTWWGMQDVAPGDAAMLLCRINPLEDKDPESIFVDGDESSPKRYRILLLTFGDVKKTDEQARTLSQWLGIARDKKLKYHTWIDEYERGMELSDATVEKAQDIKGLTKQQVIGAFEGMHFSTDKKWSTALASPPNWLKECRVMKGSKRTSALWNPVLIACALFDRDIRITRLDAVFVRLKDWTAEWQEASTLFR